MVGIDPGGTKTRSATLRPCERDIAAVTLFLMTSSSSIASPAESPRSLSSMTVTNFSV
ncbi:Uncharacterised protein [Mycobacterium tuberculosis]|nr:Uncharacterised protein [Mycobacterium tuberculosis]